MKLIALLYFCHISHFGFVMKMTNMNIKMTNTKIKMNQTSRLSGAINQSTD